MTETSLRILVVDPNAVRASILEEGLREAGYANVSVVRDMDNLLRRIVEADPEVIFIDLENPNRDVLEQMFQVSRCVHRPIAMFVDQSDSGMIEAAVEAGVGAYVVDGLRKERIRSILDMAVSRFNAFSRLREELDRTRQALEERKVVERAKGILMKARGLGEEEAYDLMRKAAMN
jgi:response regulator NasT